MSEKVKSIEIEEDKYIIDIGHDVIDVAKLTQHDWNRISYIAKNAIKVGVTSESSKAYIIAFVIFISQYSELTLPFDPNYDKIN